MKLRKISPLGKKLIKISYNFLLILIIVSMFVCSVLFICDKKISEIWSSDVAKETLGTELVKALYEFNSAYELESNMLIVSEIVTPDVYNDISLDNEERTMLTYLKFKDCSTEVEIIDSSDNYVRYRIISDAISADREFILFYYVNKDGKVYDIEEAEYVKFLDTIY